METTHEEIWAMLRELIVSQQETDLRFKETERLLKQQSQETDKRFQETDKKFQETDKKFQDTDKKFQDTERLLKQQSQDTDKKFQETDRKIKAVSTQIGQLGSRLGQFVEEMVRPAVVRLFHDRGFDVRQVLQNLSAQDVQGRIVTQIDLLVLNTDVAIVIECKSQPSTDDVNEHLERLDAFKTNFHQYANFCIYGAIAAMVLPQRVNEYAIRKGLYCLAQSGDAMVIHNETAFVPKQW